MKMIENEMNVTVHLEIIKASEIEPKEVKWLWYPYIPFGKVTLLQGDPGNGKSKLMLSIAALLSNGERLYLSCGFYFRQERRIACSAEKGERNGEKQQGGKAQRTQE